MGGSGDGCGCGGLAMDVEMVVGFQIYVYLLIFHLPPTTPFQQIIKENFLNLEGERFLASNYKSHQMAPL
jgi:hypothetical protein